VGVARALFSILRGRIEVSTWSRTRRYNAAMDTYTLVHVILSLIGILSGLVILYGLCTANPMNGWTLLFLVTHRGDFADRFWLPLSRGHSCHHRRHPLTAHPDGGDRGPLRLSPRRFLALIYVVGARGGALLQCLRARGAVVPARPRPARLAPNGSEPPFAITQGIVLVLFIAAGILAVKKFHPITR